ncbi:FAD-dependent oxidoreductase [Pelagovum pacificum]|uniref:FAD-binding protein n=1 Tax=Pelagovum pacificum TaxID=2588711 RepID=A0A5C5G7R5_9RHOB|nr:FAD-dependent oxidoreductase [Pelagovum pacificum]QQA41968.1 FAD-dependent oxidoreductase [Pelagovum pacificum]TNY30591.1 FAD-binding protein [Pelagovum pacificum]
MPDFPTLLSPITLGGCEIRNRVCLTGHGTGMPTDGTPNDQMIDYYEERAKGEVGLIMLGSQQVHPSSPGITGLLCNYDDAIIPGLSRLATRVQQHGTKVFGYLSHMGFATSARPVPLWSASADYEAKYGEVAHEMTVQEIAEVVTAHADAAARCVEAGLDGIEVHCGHGLLVQQFLSPLTNHRTDAYGGSEENRSRFAAEILSAVRRRIGPDVPLGIRCSGDELVPGGLTGVDMARIVPRLVAAGALDYVDVSAGTDGNLVSNMLHEPPMGLPPGPFRSLSRQLKESLDIPVIHGTRIHTAEFAEDMLARGDADMAGFARALIADPYLPRKAREGAAGRITPCIACEQACFGRLYRGRAISCIGTPATGREARMAAPSLAQARRRVIVVGAGPAGLEAGLVAARRGHDVTVLDAAEVPGGMLDLARRPVGRSEWSRLIEHKVEELKATGGTLHLGRRADAEGLAKAGADHVILASGARPRAWKLPGASENTVLSLEEAVRDWSEGGDRIGRRVLIADEMNRAPGLALALSLARSGHEVSLSTPAFHAGQNLEIQNLTYFQRECLTAGVTFFPTVVPIRMEGDEVVLHNLMTRTETMRLASDTVVAVVPGLPDTHLGSALTEAGISNRTIGDAYAPRDAEAAILEGHEAGLAS